MELFICIKMDLALNNLQRLICHKPNQPIVYEDTSYINFKTSDMNINQDILYMNNDDF